MAAGSEIVRPIKAPFSWAEPFSTIGVTGTNGKTSTTHMVADVLAAVHDPVLVESTLGCWLNGERLRVERSFRGFLDAFRRASQRNARYAAIEVTSHALATGFAKKWRFDHGVFTNLSRDHIAQHGSFEHYLASKAQLFLHLSPGGWATLNAADENALLIDQVTPPDVKRFWFGSVHRGPLVCPADLYADGVEVSLAGTRVRLENSPTAEMLGGELELGWIGEVFAENALAAVGATLGVGVDPASIRKGLRASRPVAGRFEVLHTEPAIVLDYAHSPDALARTCRTARKVVGAGRLIVVFGAGGGADPEKREPMGRAVAGLADEIFVTNDNPRGEDPRSIADAIVKGMSSGRAEFQVVLDRGAAIERAIALARPADLVLIAGRGRDTGMVIGSESLPYSDVLEVERIVGSVAR